MAPSWPKGWPAPANFAQMMTEQARAIGMTKSIFKNSNGLFRSVAGQLIRN